MIVLLLLSVERCKFFDSKMKPLLLTYNNFDKGDEKLLKIIFKHGDGELVFAHYHNIMPPRCVIHCGVMQMCSACGKLFPTVLSDFVL